MSRSLCKFAFLFSVLLFASQELKAAILTSGFFSGQIQRFEEVGGAPTTFATVANANDPFPGLSGLAIDPASGRVFTSARISHRIYSYDSQGTPLGFYQLPDGTSPAGMTFGSNGRLYVSGNANNTVTSYDVTNPLSFVQQNQITIPGSSPSGLAFDLTGRLLISTFAGAGVLGSDASLSASSSVANVPLANGQIVVDANNNFYVGTAAFGNNVYKFTASGTEIGNPWLTLALPTPPLPFVSPDFTSPVGVAVDANGNVLVGALGQTNPTSGGDNFQSNGGLFRFGPNGNLLQNFGGGLTPISAVAVVPVPEPTTRILVSLGALLMFRRRMRAPA